MKSSIDRVHKVYDNKRRASVWLKSGKLIRVAFDDTGSFNCGNFVPSGPKGFINITYERMPRLYEELMSINWLEVKET